MPKSTEIATNIGKEFQELTYDNEGKKYLYYLPNEVKSYHLNLVLSLLEAQKREMEECQIPDTGNEKMARSSSVGKMMKEFQRCGFNSALDLAIGILDANIKIIKEQLS